jgi:methylglutaconyl-CoA hydratase
MAHQHVLTEIDSGVGMVTLNRADRGNALDGAMIAELTEAMGVMATESAVRVVVISSLGTSFCTGTDAQWMQASLAKAPADNLNDVRAAGAMFRSVADCPKPTVARVQGMVLGGGIGLVAACDIAIASFDADFAFTETQRGLIPGVISPFILSAMSIRHARRYMLTGEPFSASEAYRLGLVHEIVADPLALDDALVEVIGALLGNGPVAMAECKSMLSLINNRPVTAELLDHIAQRSVRVRLGTEGSEGLAAFLENRLPNWAKS